MNDKKISFYTNDISMKDYFLNEQIDKVKR